MTTETHEPRHGRQDGPQEPVVADADVTLRAASRDDVWCPREGWIPLPPAGRTGSPAVRYCPRHPNTAVERHWGPCPSCWTNRVYRTSYGTPAPPCGACQGILRGRPVSPSLAAVRLELREDHPRAAA